MSDQTVSGTVKWYNEEKGFGFIREESCGDVFVHQSALIYESQRPLLEGQRVTMEIIQNPKGFQATNVALAETELERTVEEKPE
ncbi:MAG: cold shock domain-containing protein [Planctomycetes bacterium]|nr:cold shock domain-containing protein [Planctomycetota bacterium]